MKIVGEECRKPSREIKMLEFKLEGKRNLRGMMQDREEWRFIAVKAKTSNNI